MKENFKIKPLTKSQIIISVDRLTRFKPTEEKYLRVFKDLITSNLIAPKLKKSQIELMDYKEITEIVNEIFDTSIKSLKIDKQSDFSINKKILEYEKSVFKFDKNIEKLLCNKINYNAIIDMLNKGAPCNLKWLKTLENETKNSREEFSTKFPLEKIVLVEGITEEILLPIFAEKYGFNFDKKGILLISAGGKNQVVKLFYKYAEILKLPIFVLLDCDAKSNYNEILAKMRKQDKIQILSGEFEDLLAPNLIKRTINRHFKNFFSIKIHDLRADMPMTKILDELFKSYGLEFKKAEFANLVAKNIQKEDLTKEIEEIFAGLV